MYASAIIPNPFNAKGLRVFTLTKGFTMAIEWYSPAVGNVYDIYSTHCGLKTIITVKVVDKRTVWGRNDILIQCPKTRSQAWIAESSFNRVDM